MSLHELYQERYAGEMKFRTSPRGLHSAIVAELAPVLRGRSVIDIGCGAGRLALFCAAHGADATGIDFSENAIALARLIADGLVERPPRLEFRVDSFERVTGRWDVVLLTEVFEHIEWEPRRTLARLRELVAPGGVIAVSCPGFVNFRGAVWMTLQNLFGFLMSPSDVHFIFPWQVTAWCAELGLVVERQVNLFHDWGWGAWCAADMKQRIGYALRDQVKSDPAWEKIAVDLERMRAYLDEQGQFYERVFRDVVEPRLRRVPDDLVAAGLVLRPDVAATPLGAEITDYLRDARVPYAAEPPLNALGATSLYFLRAT